MRPNLSISAVDSQRSDKLTWPQPAMPAEAVAPEAQQNGRWARIMAAVVLTVAIFMVPTFFDDESQVQGGVAPALSTSMRPEKSNIKSINQAASKVKKTPQNNRSKSAQLR